MIPWNRGLVIVGAVMLALLGALWWQHHKVTALQEDYRTLALKAVNDSAALDTTRRLALSRKDSLAILGDSLAAVTHLSVQVTDKADALDRALKQERTATQKLTAQVKALHTTSTATVETTGDVRRASFAIDSTPYHGTAAVALPATGTGSLDLRLHVDRAELDVVLGCAAPNAQGIRPASVSVVGPRWLDVGVTSSRQSPEICNAVKPASRRWYGAPDLVFGFGRILGQSGSSWGAFVGVGGRIGP
jgi:hypothetical protein